MEIPFEPILFGWKLNIHLILEYVAFFVAFRYYVYLRRKSKDVISYTNRLSIILGATIGALIGSRVMGWLEYPFLDGANTMVTTAGAYEIFNKLLNTKTIMGGLFGGLLGVELAKKIIKETSSSGDLFTLPIILGIFIGRLGCFLYGVNEFTYGNTTSSFLGMDLGDGLQRHPIALYEMFFLFALFFLLKWIWQNKPLPSGKLFGLFMISYFSFRFIIEFLKPNEFLILGWSSIQYLCLICIIYYRKTILYLIR